MNIKLKKMLAILVVVVMVIGSFPTKVDAHRAYFLQVLIDEGQLQYVSNVIKDSELKESNKTEAKLWNYKGGVTSDYESLESGNGDTGSDDEAEGKNLPFTFPSKAHKSLGIFKAKNNATSRDEGRAYSISDTLIPNINELLIIMNGGRPFNDIDELMEMSILLASSSESGSTISKGGASISFSGDYATVTIDGKSHDYLYRMKKGYKSPKLEAIKGSNGEFKEAKDSPLYGKFDYSGDVDYITIGAMITQANYTYVVKGHSAVDSSEYAKPGTIEIKLMEFLSSTLASLRSLLGLRDIEELVFNQGIVGSSMYYNGLMPTSWFQKSMAFHMIFQAMTWIALGIAIIKLAFQRNLATISASSRISLMDGIKDLIIAGFMLMGIFIGINLMGTFNKAVVNIFSNTVPNYGDTLNAGLEMGTFGGVLLQLYYFLITVYLNVIYVARAISLAILIAIAPIFVGSIAFQSKSKEFFETWGRMLIADIFVQSFHAFILSFFLSIQMSTTRGIELAVVSFALIPATKMFKEIITRNSGGLMAGAGAGLGMAGAVAGGAIGGMRGGGKSNYKGSMDEGGGFNHLMNKEGISRKAPSISTTKDTFNAIKTNASDKMVAEDSIGGSTSNSSSNIFKEQKSNKLFKNTGTLEKPTADNFKKAGGIAKDLAVGGTKLTAGIAAGMALGSVDNGRLAGSLIGGGMSNIKSGAGTAGEAVKGFTAKGINTITEGFGGEGTMIGAEKLDNGNVAIHRDRSKLKSMGLEEAVMTDTDNLELTYDTTNMNKVDRDNINTIKENAHDNKWLKERGIEGVYDTQDGKVAVQYNDYGKEQLGYSKAYTDKNSIVEIKRAGQPINSNLTYDANKVKAQSSKESTPSVNYSKPTGKATNVLDGPTDGGQSQYNEGGQPTIKLDDYM